ncbi:GIY-YIG nuclease family protein [Saccharicrinis sp. FJH54]|uniref:GIY-YIG nuclease family protein n=1 Tax=Saccharicrinis sp. FJH54 TaxID=3344665 RepID=UPI0035D3DF99
MRKLHVYYVYILTSSRHAVLYVGMTNNLIRRTFEHKLGKTEGFTKKYKVNKLVYYELFYHVDDAINREKQIKKYNRKKKEELINSVNPDWKELYSEGQILKIKR